MPDLGQHQSHKISFTVIMLKLLVCVFLLIAVIRADYDFQNSDFNELLIDDMETDIEEDVLQTARFRRGADSDTDSKECYRKKGKKERDSHCCNGERGDPQELDVIKEVKKNCIAEIRGESADEVSFDPLNCDSIQTLRQQMVCAAECMAKKFDLIAENGDLKRDAVIKQTRKMIGENKWKSEMLETFVDKCLLQLKESNGLKNAEDTNSESCNPRPLEFHHCIWKEFVEGCPVESQIDSKKCKKIRERLSKGDTSYADKSFKRRLHFHH